MSAVKQKRMLFVGGLAPEVTEELLQASFIPFGDIKSVSIPREKGETLGYGFVEFETSDDCKEAMFNMDGNEIFNRTINCAPARPMKIATTKAIWDNEEAAQQQE